MKLTNKFHKIFLSKAIELAAKAGTEGNHPCGTVIINSKGKVVGASGNKVFTSPDITAHAEMLCLRKASLLLMDKKTKEKYILFSSCEPCSGCAFYIARTNIKKIVFASKDKYRPGITMLKQANQFKEYFKDIDLIAEPVPSLRDLSLTLMRDFFNSQNRPEVAKFFEPIENR